MGCANCGRGFHFQCRKCLKGKCHPVQAELIDVETSQRGVVSQVLRKSVFKDPQSTGRKRAAKLYPIDRTKACEWQGFKECGGGRFPVIGCYNNKQAHRHHGPIKNPLNNYEGNVHRICYNCHVRWHELNDVDYSEADNRLLPHKPVPANDLEAIQNDLDWKSGKIAATHTLKSSVEGLKSRKLESVD